MIDPKEDIDWDKAREEILKQEEYVTDDGTVVKEICLGAVFYLTPSGKYYMPWACSNITEEEAEKDAEWFETLDEEAEKHNMYITSGIGDPCDIMLGMVIRESNEEDNKNER